MLPENNGSTERRAMDPIKMMGKLRQISAVAEPLVFGGKY